MNSLARRRSHARAEQKIQQEIKVLQARLDLLRRELESLQNDSQASQTTSIEPTTQDLPPSYEEATRNTNHVTTTRSSDEEATGHTNHGAGARSINTIQGAGALFISVQVARPAPSSQHDNNLDALISTNPIHYAPSERWKYNATYRLWIRKHRSLLSKTRLSIGIGGPGTHSTDVVITCKMALHTNTSKSDERETAEYCILAAQYLREHREKFHCLCDYEYLVTGRSRVDESRLCVFRMVRSTRDDWGRVVYWVGEHDVKCGCGCFGQRLLEGAQVRDRRRLLLG